MRYFVIGPNGELYGPADIPTLNQWITEGRLTPTSILQEELGGARFAASMLKELNFTAAYPRIGPQTNASNGENEIKTAWIMGAVGFLCCTYLTPVGIVFAFMAKKKGHPKANAAIIFTIVMTVLAFAWMVYYIRSGGFQGLMKQLGG